MPSCASSFLLQTVLRDAWNFSGYVTSDSGAIADIYSQHHYLNSTAAEGVAYAIKAGCDIDSSLENGYFNSGSPYVWYARNALSAGLITEADVNALVRRTLRIRFELGLFDPIDTQPYWHYDPATAVDTAQSQALNNIASRAGLVLLKNEAALLPLDKRQSLALIGPHVNAQYALVGNYLGQICAEGFGVYSCILSPAEAIRRAMGPAANVMVVEGCDVSTNSTQGFAAALAAAEVADTIVLMLGLDTTTVEREGHDRTALGLPGAQQQLLEAVVAVGAKRGRRVVLVTLSGGPVALDWAKTAAGVGAIIHAFYPGGSLRRTSHSATARCLPAALPSRAEPSSSHR